MTAKLNVKQKELLITEVQKRPLLHDLKNTGYKNTQLKAKEWAIDGAAVGEIPGNRIVVNFNNHSYSNSS